MKKIELFVVWATMVLLFGACGGGNKQQVDYSEFDGREEGPTVDPYRDTTIYGICGSGSAMNTLQMITDNGDTITVSTMQAHEAERVFGGYAVGDRLAVLVNKDSTVATMVLNESVLLGDWVMPNPIDGSDEIGISIKEGGIADGIKQSSIIYKSWRIFNGRLEIDLEREGGIDIEEHQSCQILYLSNDSLVYKDMAEDGDLYQYNRQRIVHEKEIIKLEESNYDDFLW